MKNTKNKISSMAAALAVAFAPVPASAALYNELTSTRQNVSTLSLPNTKDPITYLPIDKATHYMEQLREQMSAHRSNIKAEWEEKQIPILLEKHKKETRQGIGSFHSHITICANFVEAARLALQQVPESATLLRGEITAFARSAAALRYTLEDTLAFIKSTQVALNSADIDLGITADEARSLIRSEHNNLGLEDPRFT